MTENWQTIELGDVLKQAWREERVDPAKEYRLLGTRWYAGGLFAKGAKWGRDIQADRLFRVQTGDFLYNRLFAWKGSFAVVGDGDDGFVSNEFPCFEIAADRIDVRFLFRYFSQESSWLRALGLSSGATPTSRNRLKEKSFLKMKIPLPPLTEQKRIVARIEGLATNIGRFHLYQNEEHLEIRNMLLGAFDEIAKKAPKRKMGEVAPIVRRPVLVEPTALYPELGVRSFGNGTFHKVPLTGLEIGSKRIFRIEPGDLIFSNVFAWEGAIAVAMDQDRDRYGSHRFITCVPNPTEAIAEFLCFYFLTSEGSELIGKASPGGAGRNRTLRISALENILVAVPSLEQQRKFTDVLAKVNKVRELRRETVTELDALMSSVLSKAFAGEL